MNISSRSLGVALVTILVGLTALVIGYGGGVLLWGSVFLLGYIILYGFTFLFVSSTPLVSAVAIFPMIASLFYVPREPILWAALLVAVLTIVFGIWQVQHEKATAGGTNVHRLLRAGLPALLTALSLVIAVFYYIDVRDMQKIVLVPRRAFDVAIPYLGKIFHGVIPLSGTIDPNETMDSLLYRLAESELHKAKEPSSLSQFPKEEVAKYLAEQRKSISHELGVSLGVDQRVGDVFYAVANQKATELAGSYIHLWWAALALGLFLGLKTLSIPVYWIALATNLGLFWLGRKLSILKGTEELIKVTRYHL